LPELLHAYFPSWRLGYRCNPFRALTRDEWSDLALLPDGLPGQLEKLPALTQLLGEQGTGKTSALLAIQRELQRCGKPAIYEYLPPGSDHYTRTIRGNRIFLLDEAQRLSPRWLDKLLSGVDSSAEAGPQLIISSHSDIAPSAIGRGIRTLSISLDGHPARFLRDLIERRLNYFTRPGLRGIRPTPDSIELIVDHCDSDLRMLEKILYEAYQTWEYARPIEREHVQKFCIGA
jgi:hypothetical protein